MNYDFSNITNLIAQQGTRNPQPDPMQNYIAGMGMGMKREELGLQKERLGLAREELGMRKEEWGTRKGFIEAQTQALYAELNDRDFKSTKDALEFISSYGDMINYENVNEIGSMLKKKTKGALQLPTKEQINEVATQFGIDPRLAFKFLHGQAMGGIRNVYNNLKEPQGNLIANVDKLERERERLISLGVDENDPEMKRLDWSIKQTKATVEIQNEGKKEKRHPFLELIDEYNKLPKDDPSRTFVLGKIKKESEATGWKIDVDPNTGAVSIIQGPMGEMGGVGLSKTMQTKVQEKLFNANESLAGLSRVKEMFKPEYQTLGTKLKATWASIKAFAGQDVSPGDRALLTDFSKYKAEALKQINQYIHDMTGAQLSKNEADRLRATMPDPGEHWWSGDDPISFESKLNDRINDTKVAVLRYQMLLNKGFSREEIKKMAQNDSLPGLDQIRSEINEKYKAIESALPPDLKGKERKQQALEQMRKELGMNIGGL